MINLTKRYSFSSFKYLCILAQTSFNIFQLFIKKKYLYCYSLIFKIFIVELIVKLFVLLTVEYLTSEFLWRKILAYLEPSRRTAIEFFLGNSWPLLLVHYYENCKIVELRVGSKYASATLLVSAELQKILAYIRDAKSFYFAMIVAS